MIGRIPILDVSPVVDCARWPARAAVAESFPVAATVFREGHDAVNATVVLRDARGEARARVPMRLVAPGTDRWEAWVSLPERGRWSFAVEAWGDPYATWRHDAGIKVPAGIDVELALEQGARVLERAAGLTRPPAERDALLAAVTALRDTSRPPGARLAAGEAPEVVAALANAPVRELVTSSPRYPLLVERQRALYSAWYEFFPRSEGARRAEDGTWVSGTLRSASDRLPAIAGMGFDIVYLPPIHPIGTTFRKGPNNTLDAGPNDPGVPWAIGSPAGGHDAVHPDLGTLDDFDAFVNRAHELGLEVALDLALQTSPDHPWVREHPEWYRTRPDGTIAYAENPPKKYQDIYPLNFDHDYDGLSAEVLRIVRHWIGHGVTVFRVDNPHTKPVMFWEWLIGQVRETDPDVIFLAEAFTRPPMMHTLGKVGFQQSYTYFTWRNAKWELEEYLRELAGPASAYMRPNFFVNTPDILHAYLQYGGPPAFKIRATLAATMSPSWGVYSGFELYEHVALRPGSEEYLDSEKYQYRPRDWAAAEREGRSLAPYLTRLNEIRRAHPALHELRTIRFHTVDDNDLICYSKRRGDDVVLVVVNLDPHGTRESMVHVNMPELGMTWGETFAVRDEITGAEYRWSDHNYVRLDPFHEPAHVFAVRRPAR